ncbi:jg8240 [Pararge aegeria aegeria]|uniref:Jg8240 protein n=1 Tax=Pararge aegeria aegeria TaxID=348720 RepID=A0A8S4RRQ9_9NEOP|nr:jg8240 [Pararge aegeria aegeria]
MVVANSWLIVNKKKNPYVGNSLCENPWPCGDGRSEYSYHHVSSVCKCRTRQLRHSLCYYYYPLRSPTRELVAQQRGREFLAAASPYPTYHNAALSQSVACSPTIRRVEGVPL